MVTISIPQYCPYCEEPLFKDVDGMSVPRITTSLNRCPNCHKIVKNPNNKYFEKPKYIFHQKISLIENLKRDKLNPDSDDYLDHTDEIDKHEAVWYRTCLHEDRVAAFSDALGIIQHLVYSKSLGGEIKQILALAKRIGTVADAIDELHKSGVALYDGEIKSLRPIAGDSDGYQASAIAGRDP